MDEKRSTEVSLSDFLAKRATRVALEATEALEALEEMTAALVKAKRIEQGQAKGLVKALAEREKQGSTGIGQGCAIPHCSLDGLNKTVMMIARSENGIDFNCVTGEKVRVFVLVVYPPHLDQERRAVLGRIVHLCRNTNWLRFLKAARTTREINDLVSEYDNEG